jgi:peptide/nickel transport system substrate-binding protein
MWKVRPMDGQPGLFRSLPGEWDGHLAESWAMEDNGATIVLKVRRGVKFPSGRPVTAHAFKYSFDRGLLSPGYMKLIFPTLIQVTAPEQFVVRDDYTFAIAMKAPSPWASTRWPCRTTRSSTRRWSRRTRPRTIPGPPSG